MTDAEITHDREVNALLQAAARRGRPLVIVAPGFAPAALATLRANAVTGKLPNLPIQLSESRELRKAVALTGGQLVEDGDLAAGSLPDSTWGTCEAWIADLDNSWIVVSGRP